MKIWISADIEGVAGFSHPQDGLPGGPGYPEARGWMTGEVVAACEAAKAAGATAVTIADGHGLGRNLILDQLPDWVEVISSWPRPLLIAQGAETGDVAGAALIGHHSGARQGGLMAHTIHGGRIAELRINGERASETSLHAAVLGEFGVPVILVSGDAAYCEHARELLGDVETVVTKTASGYQSARSLTPARSRQAIAEGMGRALGRLSDFQPHCPSGPFQIEVTMLRAVEAELYAYLPGFIQTDGTTVCFEVGKLSEAARILMFMACMHSEI